MGFGYYCYPGNGGTEVRRSTRDLAELLVEFGILELTNAGETYRITPEGREIVRMLVKESK